MTPTTAKTMILAACVIAFSTTLAAVDIPRVIPHSAVSPKSPSEVYGLYKNYLSDPSLSRFQLDKADESSKTITAQQMGVDSGRWSRWAACQTDVQHLVYKMVDNSIKVKVTLAPSQKGTFVTVSADFNATYEFRYDRIEVACKSTGALEDELLSVSDAKPFAPKT